MKIKNLSFFVWLLACASALIGCAGSGAAPTNTGPSAFAGQYSSTINLDSGKSGALALTVATNGSANGNLTVTAPAQPQTDANFSFTAGVIGVNGTVNSDGSFSLTGSDPTSGGFNVGGTLPIPPATSGNVQISAGGTTFTSTIGVVLGTGGSSLTFTNSGASINATPYPANPYILMSTVNGNTALTVIPSVSDTSRSLGMTFGPNATAGSTLDLSDLNVVMVAYSETASTAVWKAQSGSLKIIARSTTAFEVELVNAMFTSEEASGSFKVNGKIKK